MTIASSQKSERAKNIRMTKLKKHLPTRRNSNDDKNTYDDLPLSRRLDKSCHPKAANPELPFDKAAEIKILAKSDLFSLPWLLHPNLLLQVLTRLDINIISLPN